MHKIKSLFLTFEGIEGSGKSTQIDLLKQYFETQGFQVLLLREPGGTVFGEKLRDALLSSQVPLHPMAEAFCFASARSQLIQEKILPFLKQPKSVVLADRYMDSSIAYQGFARGLGMETILKIHSMAPLDLRPDLTIYLSIDLKTSQERQAKRGRAKDYFEKETNNFYQKLIEGYDQCAQSFPDRIKTIDARNDAENVFLQIKNLCQTHLAL